MLRVMVYVLCVMCYVLCVMCYVSCVMSHVSCVPYHISHVQSPMSNVTCHFSFVICHQSNVINVKSHNNRPSPQCIVGLFVKNFVSTLKITKNIKKFLSKTIIAICDLTRDLYSIEK